MAELISDIAIQRELGSLSGWSRKGDTLAKTYQFKSFADAIAFVNRAATAAESSDHHPDIDIRFSKVTMVLSSHDSGGITQKDLDLATALEEVRGEA